MKKILFLITLMFITSEIWGQLVTSVPGFKQSFPGFHRGDTYVTRIYNTDTVTTVFTPRYNGFEPSMFDSDSNYIAWLVSHATSTDPEENKLLVFQAETRVLKSKFFGAGEDHTIAEDTFLQKRWNINEIYHKSYSTIGGKLGLFNRKCFNTTMQTIFDLVSTGLFQDSDFSVVNITGLNNEGHTIGAWKYKGRWTKFDNDTGKKGSMHENLSSLNGFASIQDLFEDRNLISTNYLWTDVDSSAFDMNPVLSYSESCNYRDYFTDSTSKEIFPFYTGPTEKVSGTIRLCAGCALESSVEIPRYVLLDSSFLKRILVSLILIQYWRRLVR